MGRITLFTSSNCDDCDNVKDAFSSREIPFAEISLTENPERRRDMLVLSNMLYAPQVFFNDEHVGDANDIIALLERWDTNEKYPSAKAWYEAEVEKVDGPNDARLSVALEPSVSEARNESEYPKVENKHVETIYIPGRGTRVPVSDLLSTLIRGMPRADLIHKKRVYNDCFTGEEGVTALMKQFGLKEREEAVHFGRTLQRYCLLREINEEHVFSDSAYCFRLQPFHTPFVLNSHRVWNEHVDSEPLELISRLKQQLWSAISEHTDAVGEVDYLSASENETYFCFEDAVCELQGVNIASLNEDARLAFGINLYNMMVKHAFIKLGIAKTVTQRSHFFKQVTYNIGGDLLSLNDIKHGIVRANTRSPSSISSPFGKGDIRKRLCLKKLDPRVHFALNAGAKICPMVHDYSEHAIDEELRIVTLNFCESEANVSMDEDKSTLILSMVFKWYLNDFTSSVSNLPNFLITYLRGFKQQKLQKMIDTGKKISVQFKEFDWTTDASYSKTYGGSQAMKGRRRVGKSDRQQSRENEEETDALQRSVHGTDMTRSWHGGVLGKTKRRGSLSTKNSNESISDPDESNPDESAVESKRHTLRSPLRMLKATKTAPSFLR